MYDGGNITFLVRPPKKIIHYNVRLHLYLLYGEIFLRDITNFWSLVHPLTVLNLPAVNTRGQYSYILRERSLHNLMPPRRIVPEIEHYYVNDPAPPGEVQYQGSRPRGAARGPECRVPPKLRTRGRYYPYITTEYQSGTFYSTVPSEDSLIVLRSTSTMEVDRRVYGGGLLVHYYISTMIHLHYGGGS
jgi:hypothetical protein